MGELKVASLPMDYEVYVFDLYGTLVDIHTDDRGGHLGRRNEVCGRNVENFLDFRKQ